MQFFVSFGCVSQILQHNPKIKVDDSVVVVVIATTTIIISIFVSVPLLSLCWKVATDL